MATQAATLGKTGKFGDLWRRLWFLLGALVVYRIGAHIPVPGIDPVKLAELFQSQQGGILGVFRVDHHATDDSRGTIVRGIEKRG